MKSFKDIELITINKAYQFPIASISFYYKKLIFKEKNYLSFMNSYIFSSVSSAPIFYTANAKKIICNSVLFNFNIRR